MMCLHLRLKGAEEQYSGDGMRASGKVTLSQWLASFLGFNFWILITFSRRSGRRHSRDFVKEKGWDEFVRKESLACQGMFRPVSSQGYVLATGD